MGKKKLTINDLQFGLSVFFFFRAPGAPLFRSVRFVPFVGVCLVIP